MLVSWVSGLDRSHTLAAEDKGCVVGKNAEVLDHPFWGVRPLQVLIKKEAFTRVTLWWEVRGGAFWSPASGYQSSETFRLVWTCVDFVVSGNNHETHDRSF